MKINFVLYMYMYYTLLSTCIQIKDLASLAPRGRSYM